MLKVCAYLGFPIAERKVKGTIVMNIFLGLLLDADKMELRLPQDKLDTLVALLGDWNANKRKTTKREQLSFISKLSLLEDSFCTD